MAMTKKETDKAVKLLSIIIEKLNDPKTKRGGLARLGRETGLSNSATVQMVGANRIPVGHIKTFMRLADELKVTFKGRPLVKWDFRPDVFEAMDK